MTNQVFGEVMFAGVNPSTGSMLSTPWMPVRGDTATFGVEVLQLNGVSLKWFAQTRTRESVTATALMSEQTMSSTGVATAVNTTAAQEFVRYVFNTGTAAASATDFVVFRALNPSWQVDR